LERAVWGIVLAGGEGRRFGRPKQFEDAGGRRLVDYAVDVIRQTCQGVTLVLPDKVWDGAPVDAIAVGGASRAASIRSALKAVPLDATHIVVHDAAHPLAGASLVQSLLSNFREGFDAIVPIKPLTDPLKRVADGRIVATVPREGVWITQSPAAFRAEALRRAYLNETEDSPEDLILVERCGGVIGTIPGDPWNIHVTTTKDLEVVRLLVKFAGRKLE
jgi:2-C-methyl-D-erythritol 4-phosphate cytidylyltransferase